jgi:hypothetical protein
MNSIINKLTLWSQDRSVGVVTCYGLDGQGSVPTLVGALCLGVLRCLINCAQGVHWEFCSSDLEVGWLWQSREATQMIKLKMAHWLLLHNFIQV